jgi:hypothetical protein
MLSNPAAKYAGAKVRSMARGRDPAKRRAIGQLDAGQQFAAGRRVVVAGGVLVTASPMALDVRLVDLQVAEEGCDVVRGGFECDRRIAIGRPAVSLFFHRDDPTVAGEEWENSAESDLNCGPAAVKQNERNPFFALMRFVIHFDPVDRGMTALQRLQLRG